MKTRRLSVWLVAIVTLCAIALFRLNSGKRPDTSIGTTEQSNAGQTFPSPATKVGTVAGTIPAIVTGEGVSSPTPANATTNTNRGQLMKSGLDALNDVPISFYGRLEDQFGNPVIGAEVAAAALVYNGSGSTTLHLSTISDGNGMFQLQAGNGESLGIMPKKEGYALASTNTSFKYSYMYQEHISPDPNAPVVIKMWKLQGAGQPLVQIDQKYRTPFTTSPITFDLIEGKIVQSGGDVEITAARPDGIISQQNPQTWGIQLKVANGGFIESSPDEARITYAAPDGDYQPVGQFDANNGPALIDKELFLQSRNGKVFSKVHLLFRINSNPDGFMSISFKGVANDTSSRNWENIGQ